MAKLEDLASNPVKSLSTLGCPLEQSFVPAIQELRPKAGSEGRINTYAGNFGLGRYPFHTDLSHERVPPRYLALGCITGFSEVGTLLIDGHHIIHEFGEELLGGTLLRPRRPIGGELPLLRLREPSRLRFDSLFLQPANSQAKETVRSIQRWLVSQEPERIELAEAGDVLVVDNWRMLHARESVPPSARNRRIVRAYFDRLS